MKRNRLIVASTLAGWLVIAATGQAFAEDDRMCVYQLYNWNSEKGTTEADDKVVKPYSEVTDDERDPIEPRCTLCQRDQVAIDPTSLGLKGVPSFKVCHVYADDVRLALRKIAKAGDFDIDSVIGYRPGRTRGKIVDGKRTVLSNHSFGTAIDINPAHNGLYKSCPRNEFKKPGHGKCRLSIGGAWNPEKSARRTVTKDGTVYNAFKSFWKWGGDIRGDTRDMMHFSISGY